MEQWQAAAIYHHISTGTV